MNNHTEKEKKKNNKKKIAQVIYEQALDDCQNQVAKGWRELNLEFSKVLLAFLTEMTVSRAEAGKVHDEPRALFSLN